MSVKLKQWFVSVPVYFGNCAKYNFYMFEVVIINLNLVQG